MNQTIIDAVCDQIGKEFHSAFLYLAMSSDMASQGYRGAAHWLRLQYEEECRHALKLMDFLEQRRACAAPPPFERPQSRGRGVEETFRRALQTEQEITASIDALIRLCGEAHDYATQFLLLGYAAEQVEEENAVREILDSISKARDCPDACLRLDHHLARRVP